MRLQFTSLWQETREVRTLNKCIERLYNGIIKENPTLVLTLGMCPTLAVTTSAINGIGMGLSSTVVLALSNLMISLLRKAIPDGVRMPAFIVVVASFVTMVQFLMQGFLPSLYDSLGIYIPLIVVNCIILGRAESYASKNPVIPSMFDGIGMGLGFTFGLTCIAIVREFIGTGAIFGVQILPLAALDILQDGNGTVELVKFEVVIYLKCLASSNMIQHNTILNTIYLHDSSSLMQIHFLTLGSSQACPRTGSASHHSP